MVSSTLWHFVNQNATKAIINATQINQWKNTSCVLKWFNNLGNKKSLSFISFDVCDFYPSITEKLLNKALDFASKYRKISKQERDIILHAMQSLLFWNGTPWEKKGSNNKFDVTMGSYDGAETCEQAGGLLYPVHPYKKVRSEHRTLPR